MTVTIAFSGKGGTGKTTLAGLLVKYLVARGKSPILVVDADPNYNLNEVLGVEVETTLGEARERMKRGEVPSGMAKNRFMSMQVEEAVEETKDYDLVVMGQPEGQGCYCAANTLLSDFMGRLTENYGYVVMDNEAGMEHISRLTTRDLDHLLVVADPSRRGLQAATRIKELAESLNIGADSIALILNNVREEPSEQLLQMVRDAGLELLGCVFEDAAIHEFDLQGRPTYELPEDNPAVQTAFDLFERIID